MFCNKCSCHCQNNKDGETNRVEITAIDFNSKKNWMANNKIEIYTREYGSLSKLLAVRICNKILEKSNIDFKICELKYSRE